MEFYHWRDTGRHRLLVRSIMEKVCPAPFFAKRVAGRGAPILISGWSRILRLGQNVDFCFRAGGHTPDTWLTHTLHTFDTTWRLWPRSQPALKKTQTCQGTLKLPWRGRRQTPCMTPQQQHWKPVIPPALWATGGLTGTA